MRSRQFTGGRSQPVTVAGHHAVEQRKTGLVAAHQGHRIGDQHNLAARLGLQRQGHGFGTDVVAIGDQTAPGTVTDQRRANHARFAGLQWRHGVIQVCKAGCAGSQRCRSGHAVGIGVAEADFDPQRNQLANIFCRNIFRRQRHHFHAQVVARINGQLLIAERPDKALFVGALLRPAQVRPLEMHADHTRHAFAQRRGDRIRGPAHDIHAIGDQRGHKAGGAVTRVR